jgi:hypothetical protein
VLQNLLFSVQCVVDNKGNNKITEHRAIFQKEKAKLIRQQIDKISQHRKTGKTVMAKEMVD